MRQQEYVVTCGGEQYCFHRSPQLKYLLLLLENTTVDEAHLHQILANYAASSGVGACGVYDFDFVVENQRGMKFFGIPLFSDKSLLPFVDPLSYQLLNGKDVLLNYDNLENYPLPDLRWRWCWSLWYILMIDDVDDQGWIYLHLLFRNRGHWKGKYYFGNFVRRRVWVRMRHQPDQSCDHDIEPPLSSVLHVNS